MQVNMSDYVTNIDLADAAKTILAAKRPVITTHAKPDGDAFGSVVALASAIRSRSGGLPASAQSGGDSESGRSAPIAGDASSNGLPARNLRNARRDGSSGLPDMETRVYQDSCRGDACHRSRHRAQRGSGRRPLAAEPQPPRGISCTRYPETSMAPVTSAPPCGASATGVLRSLVRAAFATAASRSSPRCLAA